MAGGGTSKEDKRRKRRSLPHEKKPQADKARVKARIKKAREAQKKILGAPLAPGFLILAPRFLF